MMTHLGIQNKTFVQIFGCEPQCLNHYIVIGAHCFYCDCTQCTENFSSLSNFWKGCCRDNTCNTDCYLIKTISKWAPSMRVLHANKSWNNNNNMTESIVKKIRLFVKRNSPVRSSLQLLLFSLHRSFQNVQLRMRILQKFNSTCLWLQWRKTWVQ